jgi:hypothetical protein
MTDGGRVICTITLGEQKRCTSAMHVQKTPVGGKYNYQANSMEGYLLY